VTWSSESSNVRWKTELPGVGNSSPIVSNGRVYLTVADRDSEDDSEEPSEWWRSVVSVDMVDGTLLWKTPIFSARRERPHVLNTIAAPTPVSDGRHVFVYFGSFLASVDRDGEIVWKKEIDPTYAKFSRYGAASSPVLVTGAVVVVQDREFMVDRRPGKGDSQDRGWIAAFDRDSGEEIWTTYFEKSCCSYSTPLVMRRGQDEEILFAHSGSVVSYDAMSGERLWSRELEMWQMVSSPVTEGDLLAVSGGAHNIKGNFVMRLHGSGKDTSTELLWESHRYVPQTSSPVLYQGRLFTVTDQGVLVCYEAETGRELWKKRLRHARSRASLVAGDGKLYVTSEGGWVSVVAADSTYQLLGENSLGELGSNASPAIADGCLLIRMKQHLVCIENEGV